MEIGQHPIVCRLGGNNQCSRYMIAAVCRLVGTNMEILYAIAILSIINYIELLVIIRLLMTSNYKCAQLIYLTSYESKGKTFEDD